MKFLIKAIYLLSPLILVIMIIMNNITKYTDLTYLLPMLFGIFSYTWMLWQFILSARPKLIERQFGLDKMYRFHGIIALAAVGMILIHKSLFEMIFSETVVTQLGSIALFFFLSVTALSLLFMSTRLLKKLPVFGDLVRTLNTIKIFSYERIKLVHNMTFIALLFMQVHVLLTSSAQQSPLIFTTYMLYFFIATGFYLYHKVYKPWFLEDKKYEVSSIHQETVDTWTIELSPKEGEPFHYVPGQFGFFSVQSQGFKMEEHPFTISSSPTNRTHIAITVKALGDFTQKIKDVKTGDAVMVDGPYGKFSYLDFKHEQSTVFVAGGVGITPVLSMIHYMKHIDAQRHVLLIWAVKKKEDLIQYAELEEVRSLMPNFTLIPVVSNDDTWTGERGRLNYHRMKSWLSSPHFQNQSTGYFVCGPENLLQTTLESLKQIGISKNQIHYEQFTV
ncbi:ferredoxin reductase family protein [Fusibacter bizertensis]